MAMHTLFATPVYEARLATRGLRALNARLLRECRQLRRDDKAGRAWSARHYAGGYTSYGSAHRMQRLSPNFARLAALLDPHVLRFAAALGFELRGRALSMTDCWVNIMSRGAAHGAHLHPLATISGTYYVSVPRSAPGLKFEDPRLERFMAAPPRRGRRHSPWVTLPARTGQVLLFESWLRHEVPRHAGSAERVSISFNYNWF